MATGWTLDYVLSLDVVTFNALMGRMVRIRYDDLTEKAWVSVATTNAGFSGKTKGVEKLTNAWAGNTGRDQTEVAKRTGRDANAFLRDFKLLGGGRI
jgi:hypothetical protein